VTDLPQPSGDHPVGVRDFELADDSRKGVMAAGPDEARRLLVRVWYPASNVDGLAPRPYFSDAEVDSTATALGGFVGAPFAFKYIGHSMTNSFGNAPLLPGAKKLPAVIYSHGYTSFAGQNTALMEELASHGYIVYSIQHTYDSAATVFPNGDVVDPDPKLMEEMMANLEPSEAMKNAFAGSTFQLRYDGHQQNHRESLEQNNRIAARSVNIWTDDRIFVLDEMERGNVPSNVAEIVAASDLQRTGQLGMSFGGSTTGGVCMIDPRCAAAVNLDGGDYHFTPFGENIPVPFLMFYSDFGQIVSLIGGDGSTEARGFNDFSYERPETSGLRNDVVRLKVNDVTHLGVSDFTLFVRTPVRNTLFGSINANDMIRIQNDFVLGFFDTHLRRMKADFPSGQFARHQRWVEPNNISDVREWWLSDHPEDRTVGVVLETSFGEIELALYPERAPISVANFLAYVDGGHYNGASLYRATQNSNGAGIGVIQGGLWGDLMGLSIEELQQVEPPLPPIAHETTDQTGILNERGTIAFARLAPGTAAGEFFFNISDNPGLDTGATSRNPDGQGYATFGRVLRGIRVLEQIQALPTDAPTDLEVVKGQLLTNPVVIERVYRTAE
jgi:predicted dienelactone hydrolase